MKKVVKKTIILLLKVSMVIMLIAIIWGKMIKVGWVSDMISQWIPTVCIGVCSVLFEEFRKWSSKKNHEKCI